MCYSFKMGIDSIGIQWAGMLAIALLQIGIMIFLLRSWQNRNSPDQMREALHKPLLDLTERLTRTQLEIRESVADRLNKHFLDTQERLDRTLHQNGKRDR